MHESHAHGWMNWRSFGQSCMRQEWATGWWGECMHGGIRYGDGFSVEREKVVMGM